MIILNKMITTKEEINNIPSFSSHYKPHSYLSKYKFSKEILLDIFCSEYMVYCFEDYYYDDITLNMIEEYQPHIDIEEFVELWYDLDSIREIELYCDLIIETIEKKSIKNISSWKYNLIEDYIKKIKIDNIYITLLDNFIFLLENNKYILIKNLYNKDEKIDTEELLIKKAYALLKTIPCKYSSILPLS